MCGIIAIVRRAATRPAPTPDEIFGVLASLDGGIDTGNWAATGALTVAARELEKLNTLLSGAPGVTALLRNPGMIAEINERLAPVVADVERLDREFDEASLDAAPDEDANAQLLLSLIHI